VCSWNFSADTIAQNISVYRDGTIFYTDYQNVSLETLDASVTIDDADTTKNQEWICNITLYNGTHETSDSINVSIQNSAPATPSVRNATADIGTATNVTEDSTYNYTVNSTDPDPGDTLTYYFKSSTQGFCTMTNPATGAVSCTPNSTYLQGSNLTPVNITFWVDDDDLIKAKSASLKVTFWVLPRNDPPTFSLTNQNTPVNVTLNYDISATDEESNTPFNFTLQSVPAEITPKLSIISTGASTARITYNATSPDYNDINTTGWLIEVNVSDSGNASTVASFRLNITNSGRVPYIVNVSPESPYATTQGGFVQINVTAGDYDPSDSLVFSTNDSRVSITRIQDLSPSSNATGQINFTPTDASVGSYDVKVTVTDLQLYTNYTVLSFTVDNVNDNPQIHEISLDPDNTVGNNISNLSGYNATLFSYTVNATDLDTDIGDVLTYSDNATEFDINSSTGLIYWLPSVIAEEQVHVNITVTDNQSVTTSRLLKFRVQNNSAPRFTGLANIACSESQL